MKNIPDITVLQHLERGSPHIKFRDTVQPLYIKMAGLITAYLPYIIILQTNTVIIRPPPTFGNRRSEYLCLLSVKAVKPIHRPYPDESELILINRIRSMMGKTFLSAQLLDHNIPCFPGNVEREIQ